MDIFSHRKILCVVNLNYLCKSWQRKYTLAQALITVNLEARAGWALASWYSSCNEVLRRLGFADYVYRIRISLEKPFNNSSSCIYRCTRSDTCIRIARVFWQRNGVSEVINKLLIIGNRFLSKSSVHYAR